MARQMARPAGLLLGMLILAMSGSCERPSEPAPPADGRVTAVSLVPAATELIVAMGAADQLVGVSSYDGAIEQVRPLPRVGDYQNIDWEKIIALKPARMIVQFERDRMPPGMLQRCGDLGIELVNVRFESLADISLMLTELGRALGQSEKAQATDAALHRRLDQVRASAAGRPRPRMLLVIGEHGLLTAGRGTYLNELVELSGAVNAAGDLRPGWVNLDPEQLPPLAPDVVVHLLPEASAQVVQRAQASWQSSGLPAVRAGRLHLLTQWYLTLPGSKVADVAELLYQAGHPATSGDGAIRP